MISKNNINSVIEDYNGEWKNDMKHGKGLMK